MRYHSSDNYDLFGQPLAGRYCRSCKRVKPSEEFPTRRQNGGRRPARCKTCTASFAQRRDSQRLPPDAEYDLRLRAVYGMTLQQYQDILASQNGVCALCKRPPQTTISTRGQKISRLFVDHCHKSGRIRSLLCRTCNMGLGHSHDDPQLLRAAAEYLEEHYGRDEMS